MKTTTATTGKWMVQTGGGREVRGLNKATAYALAETSKSGAVVWEEVAPNEWVRARVY